MGTFKTRAFKVLPEHPFYKAYIEYWEGLNKFRDALRVVTLATLGELKEYHFIAYKQDFSVRKDEMSEGWSPYFYKGSQNSGYRKLKKASKLYKAIEKELGEPIDIPDRPLMMSYFQEFHVYGSILKKGNDIYVRFGADSADPIENTEEIKVWEFEKLWEEEED